MEKSNIAHIESRIFGLRDYATLAVEDEDFSADPEHLFQSPIDEDRIGEDDVEDVLRDFNVQFHTQDD